MATDRVNIALQFCTPLQPSIPAVSIYPAYTSKLQSSAVFRVEVSVDLGHSDVVHLHRHRDVRYGSGDLQVVPLERNNKIGRRSLGLKAGYLAWTNLFRAGLSARSRFGPTKCFSPCVCTLITFTRASFTWSTRAT
jgi:hypothetical protein